MPEVARGDGALNPLSEAPISIEPFETGGYPVHTRTLIVELLQDADSRMRALATILDLRKQGWVPTGGELQTAGLIGVTSAPVICRDRIIVGQYINDRPSQPVMPSGSVQNAVR